MNSSETTQLTQPPLAVVGLSAIFPKSSNTTEFWSNVRRGVDSIVEVPETHWNPSDYFDQNQKTPDMTYARRGGFLSPVPFDPLEFGISPNNLEAIDTSQLLGLVGAKRALEHAGYGAGRSFDRSRVGCILGVTGTLEMVIPLGARLGHPRWRKALKDAGVSDDVAEDVVNRISESYVPWQENSFPGLLGNVVAGRIANRLDLHGTNCVVDAACASSLSAIHLAALELWTGRSDMVLTGGIDTFNDIFMFMCFSKTPALSPTGDARPFSEDADGTILGEGVGILVLKRLSDAERDGDRIYAVIKGIGTSSDGAGSAVYAPKAEGQIRCLKDAYEVSGITPDTVELVEAHGTGTKVGDATEVSGLLSVYGAAGRRGPWCAIGSVKSQIGHTKAAAGAAGVIKAILALQHRVLPPTIKVKQPPAGLVAENSPFYVNTEARPWLRPAGYPRRAAVSAFGFGGSNFHCVLEESPQQFIKPDWDGDVQVVALSANSARELSEILRSQWLTASTNHWAAIRLKAAASRKSFQAVQSDRLLLVIERDQTDLAKLVSGALTMLERYPDRVNWSTPDGAYYGRGPQTGKLGFLFPGQGAQYVGMLRELACRFPTMNDVLSVANDVYQSGARSTPKAAHRLVDYIYPFPSFTREAREHQEESLRATQIAQPAIGAVSLGALAILDQFGVRPSAVAGHSYGELTALCASRCFAPDVLFRLSMLRGELMAASQQTEGGMLAVGAPLSQIEAALKEMSVDLVLANHNSPSQVVLSGRIPEIDRAASLFASRNIRGKKLAVAAAFHSPLVAPASRAFRPFLDEVEFEPTSMPVYANSTAAIYPNEPQAARELLANQLARPVQFVGQVEQMYADGVRVFLEVGPGGVLTGLVHSILSGKEFRAVAVDASNGRRSGLYDLATALAQVSVSGHPVRWNDWDPCDEPVVESNQRLQIPICGANYVKPRAPIPPRMTPTALNADTGSTANIVTKKVETPAENKESFSMSTNQRSETAEPGLMKSPPLPPAHFVPQVISAVEEIEPIESAPVPPVAASRAPTSGAAETIRQMLDSLQRMQQETSRLHQQFLEGQEAAMKAYSQLAYLHMIDKKVSQDSSAVQAAAPSQAETALPRSPIQPAIVTTPVRAVSFIESHVAPEPAAPPKEMLTVAAPAAFPAPSAKSNPSVTRQAPKPPVAPAPIVHAAPVPAPSRLASVVLAVVSEKTGYPTDMLNLEMSLDHDLGIDSIKRVEILSALQERVPDLPAFQPEELGSLHTLLDVVNLADARAPGSQLPSTPPVNKAAATATVSAPAPKSTAASSRLAATVLSVVSEKTGYPVEMLNHEMSLDHDLGIDSIKRVEILSALQERVADLPAFQPEELGSLHTLRDVVDLADARSTGAVPQPQAPQNRSVTPSNPPSQSVSSLSATVLTVVAEKTGYPTEMLNLEMSLDHDLGIDSIKRVEILSALQERVPSLPAFQPEELGSLHTLQDVVSLADARAGSAPVPVSNFAVSSPSPVTSEPPAHSLSSTVLAVVADKTGYPVEMLNLQMSLDHDLGIDSIKRVEILSALQERVPSLPAFQPEELGALHTLQDVVGLADLRTSRVGESPAPPNGRRYGASTNGASPVQRATDHIAGGSLPSTEQPSKHSTTTQATFASAHLVSRRIVKAIHLEPAATRPAIGFPAGSEFWITDEGRGFSSLVAEELVKRGFKAKVVHLHQTTIPAVPRNLAGFIVVAAKNGMSEEDLWNSVDWLQKLGPQLRQATKSSPKAMAAVLRLDGRFGFDAKKYLQDPVSGGLAGLVKCLDREWPEVTCRAFDLCEEWSSSHVAAAMFVGEFLHQGPVELGLTTAGPIGLELVEEPLGNHHHVTPIQPGDVVVISGGARGVTAEAAYMLAATWRPRLVILGRSPEPTAEPDWLQNLTAEAEIKRALIAQAGANATPRSISQQVQQIQASREISTQLNRLRSQGVSVNYYSVDVRDPHLVASILKRVQQECGPIRGIIHGAGVLADHRIEDKTRDQFDQVYRTKVQGLKALLDNVEAGALKILGLFSSYTARFGRIGQLDYAMANEVLNKQAHQFAIHHPHCHVASFNWGPWDGGMVQGGLKSLFDAEGVGLIPLEAGAEFLVREFAQNGSRPVEVLVLADREPPSGATQAHPTNDFKVVFERTLDVASAPFLESHALGGKAVLPVAMIMEWLAHGAIHRNPGLELLGFENLRVYQGIRLGLNDCFSLRVTAEKPVRHTGCFKTAMRLVRQENHREIIHAAATVVLGNEYPPAPSASFSRPAHVYPMELSAAYANRLFHGAQFRAITAIDGCSTDSIVVKSRVAPTASVWMTDPVRANWLADPLAIDAALQAIILWSQEYLSQPCLPCAIGTYRQFMRSFPKAGVTIVVRVLPQSGQLIHCDVEIVDSQGGLVAKMENCESVADRSLAAVFRNNQVQ